MIYNNPYDFKCTDIEVPDVLHNSIKCPDGTILVSRSRYNFVEHRQEDGRQYFVDGGLDYQRIGFSDKEFIDLSVHTKDEHLKIREHFEWGNRFDKDMNLLPELIYIKLKDITEGHLKALCEYTREGYKSGINKVFMDEVVFRKVNNIG